MKETVGLQNLKNSMTTGFLCEAMISPRFPLHRLWVKSAIILSANILSTKHMC